jgi:hypothetical protein
MQVTGVQMNLLQISSYNSGKNDTGELTNRSVHRFWIRCKLNLQTDSFNLRKVLTDELTNRSVR